MSYTWQRRYRGRLQAAIFDWAGTTVDFGSRAPAGVFVEVFRRWGVEITEAQAREPMGLPKREHIKTILAMPEIAPKFAGRHDRPWNEKDVDEIYKQFIPLQLDCLPDYSDPIPGVVDAVARFRKQGLKIGSTTGYNREMLEVLLKESGKRGFSPDSAVAASEVPAGRPEPWMCQVVAMQLRVFPPEAIVKVGDTLPDVDEGLNAGMWTVGVVRTGNELGLTEKQIDQLPAAELEKRLSRIRERFLQAGAHYVVDGVADLDPVLEQINERLARGETP